VGSEAREAPWRSASPASIVLAGGLVALAAALGGLCAGAVSVSPAHVWSALAGGSGQGSASVTPMEHNVVLLIRLPRVVAALCVGAGLGVAGCMLQALLCNPLASPFVIGASAAAGFGAVSSILLGLSYVLTLGSSFALATGSGFLVVALARGGGRLPRESLVLTGFSVGLLFGALTGLVEYATTEEAQLREMVLWMLGGLWRITWDPLIVLVPGTLLCLLAAARFSRELDLLALGEDDAVRLGLDATRARAAVLVLSALLTALAVSVSGVIAFVGLVVPHLARRFVGVTHGRLLPASAFLGAIFLVIADTVARTAFLPNELPLGVVTSLVGIPFFLWVQRAGRRGGVAA